MRFKVPKIAPGELAGEERQALLDAARKYIGVRWLHMGRNAQGVDCVGLLIVTVHDVFGAWVAVEDYSPWPSPSMMRDMCNRILTPIRREEMLPGDVALLYAPGVGVVHLGWYAGKTLIHASNELHARKVIETTIHPEWNLRGAYSVPRFVGNLE